MVLSRILVKSWEFAEERVMFSSDFLSLFSKVLKDVFLFLEKDSAFYQNRSFQKARWVFPKWKLVELLSKSKLLVLTAERLSSKKASE